MSEQEDMQRQIEQLKAENDRLKNKRAPGELSLKVSEKGGVSVYGLGRFPVTLYQEQWDRLLANTDAIRTFIDDNRAQLKKKE